MILPLTQSDSTRPVYDASGKVVSFTQHSEMIVKALNLVWLMSHADAESPVEVFRSLAVKAQEIVGVK